MKIVIMSGIPGSGKSTYVQKHYKDSWICSADSYFLDGSGNYNYQPEKIGEAHAECLRRFALVMREPYPQDIDYVIVDNTNLSTEEIAPYYELAVAYGHDVEIVTVLCDPHVAAKRNKHSVPSTEIQQKWLRLMNRRLPERWVKSYIGETGADNCWLPIHEHKFE